MTSKILFVDDDPSVLSAFQRNFRNQFSFDTALSGVEGLRLLRTHGPYALLVVDMRMPEMDGVEFLEQARKLAPDAVRIMLTGNADQQTAIDAVNRGQVFRFFNKPCPPEVLVPGLEHGLKQFEFQHMERELLEGTLTGSVKMMTEILGMVAPDALSRGQRLRESMRYFAESICAKPLWELDVAALLSPIGYFALPAPLLQKLSSGAELAEEERIIVRRVPRTGHDLLCDIPRLEGVARIVLYQNKSFDGSGFPTDDCAGEEIPLGARMLKILGDRLRLEADGIAEQSALDTMRGRVGVYDPSLLELCFACFRTFLANAISADRPVFLRSVKELEEGQLVVSDITTPGGVVLVGAGQQLTAKVIDHLRDYEELKRVKQPVFVQEPSPTSAT